VRLNLAGAWVSGNPSEIVSRKQSPCRLMCSANFLKAKLGHIHQFTIAGEYAAPPLPK